MVATNFIIGGIVTIGIIVALAITIPLAIDLNNEEQDINAPILEEKQTLDANTITQEQVNELISAFDNCDPISQPLFYEDYEFNMKITGQEEEKCLVTLTLTKAPGLQTFAVGTNADCKLSRSEIDLLQSGDMNITDLDCSGPLYDLAAGFMD